MRVVDPKAHQRRIWCIERAALRLIAAHGYAETSLEQVAEACRMRKASLYHYFDSKEALLHGIIEAMVRKMHAQVLNMRGEMLDMRERGRSLEGSLYQIGMKVLENMSLAENRNFTRILERDAGTNSYIRRVFFKVANRTMGGAEKTLLTPGLWKGRRISAREHLMHMHQYMGCMFRYAVETRLWKSGPAMGFGDRNYVRSLARIFAKGIRA